MTPTKTLNLTRSHIPHIGLIGVLDSQISVRFALWPAVLSYRSFLKKGAPKDTKMILNTTSQRYPYTCVTSIREFQISPQIPLHPFSRLRVVDNRKCTKWPQNDLEHLTVKNTLYTLNTCPQGSNFCSFHSTTSCYKVQDIGFLKIGKIWNAQNDLRLILNT